VNTGNSFASACETATIGTVRRSRPVIAPSFTVIALSDSSARSTAGPASRSNRSPAAVGATLRDERASRLTPSLVSSCRTDWLSAELEMPSSRAAAAKLRRRATATNAFRLFSGV